MSADDPSSALARGLWLALDASGPHLRAGSFRDGHWLGGHTAHGPALEQLPGLLARCLDQAATRPDALAGFLFCDGPGSILSLRLGLLSLRVWQRLGHRRQGHCPPFITWHSLAFALWSVGGRGTVLLPWKRDTWQSLTADDPEPVLLDRGQIAKQPAPLHCLPAARIWTALPEARPVDPPPLEALPAFGGETGAWRLTEDPELVAPGATRYRAWEQHRHSAADAPPPAP
ncbi:MAG: hypothetical protein ACFE0O_12705 [Opitutales bacterium]